MKKHLKGETTKGEVKTGENSFLRFSSKNKAKNAQALIKPFCSPGVRSEVWRNCDKWDLVVTLPEDELVGLAQVAGVQMEPLPNPAVSAGQYRLAAMVAHSGRPVKGMTPKLAREIVKQTPKKLRSKFMKTNPGLLEESESADEVSKGFHGRDNRDIEDIIEIEKYHTRLASLGDIEEIEVVSRTGKSLIPIQFDKDGDDRTVLCCTKNRQQLLLMGGDQKLDLGPFRLSDTELRKDHVFLGEIYTVTYFTDKHHLEGPEYQKDGTSYQHTFAEEGGERPCLVYDTLNDKMLIVGGDYEIRDEGIYN